LNRQAPLTPKSKEGSDLDLIGVCGALAVFRFLDGMIWCELRPVEFTHRRVPFRRQVPIALEYKDVLVGHPLTLASAAPWRFPGAVGLGLESSRRASYRGA